MYSKADQHRGNFLFSSSFFLISPSGLNKAVKMKNNSSAYPKKMRSSGIDIFWEKNIIVYALLLKGTTMQNCSLLR